MKKLTLIFLYFFLCFSLSLFAQENKYGLKEISRADRLKIENSPKIVGEEWNASEHGKVVKTLLELPKYIDHSRSKYFPTIIRQIGGSCGAASMIHYQYTYEYCAKFDLDASNPENLASYMYAWNFLNGGNGGGITPWNVISLIMDAGVMPESEFSTTSNVEWPNGYEKYEEGIKRVLFSWKYIYSNKTGGIEKIKRYLYDRGKGISYGGLLQFSAYADPLDASNYTGASNSGYNKIIPKFGSKGMHSMVIVGYDDDVWYDYNDNGIKDSDELGAFICVNSWGPKWGDNGRFYAPYRTFTSVMKQGEGGTGNGGKYVYILEPRQQNLRRVVRIGMNYSSRNDLSLTIGLMNSDLSISKRIKATIMTNRGGDYPLLGVSNDIMRFSHYMFAGTKNDDQYFYARLSCATDKGVQGKGKVVISKVYDYSENQDNPKIYYGEIQGNLSAGDSLTIVYKTLEQLTNSPIYVSSSLNKGILTLNITAKKEDYVVVDIVDINGNLIKSLIDDEIAKGDYSKTYNLTSLSSFDKQYYLRVNVVGNIRYNLLDLK